jgi:hypothetical protein
MIPLPALMEVGSKILDKVLPNEEAKAKALAELKKIESDGKLGELNINLEEYKTEQNNVSERWKADMSSDSWLSKNIRPMSLIAIFTGYFLFAMMSAFGYNANESYVTLLGNWGMLVFGAYFGSRSLEKITEIRNRK